MLFLLSLVFVPVAWGDEALLERFLAEAPRGWDHWAAQLIAVEAKFHFHRSHRVKDGPWRDDEQFTQSYFTQADRVRMEFDRKLAEGRVYHLVSVRRAREYRFLAESYDDRPPAISEMEGYPAPLDVNDLANALRHPYSVRHVDLREIVRAPRYAIQKVSRSNWKGVPLVRVEIENTIANSGVDRFRHATLWLDPARNWGIVRAITTPPEVGRTDVAVRETEYGKPLGGICPILRSTQTIYDDATLAHDSHKEVEEFEFFRKCDKPDEFFRPEGLWTRRSPLVTSPAVPGVQAP